MPGFLATELTSTTAIDVRASGLTGNQLTLEVNRAPDFAADDSLFFGPYAQDNNGGAFATVYGLPAGTPFYIRGLESNGLITNTTVRTTVPVAPSLAYAGFSIDKALLVLPEAVFNMGVGDVTTGGTVAFPVTNLLLDDPAAVFRSAGPGSFYIDFDTSGVPIDTIALLGSSFANDGVTYQLRGDDTAANRGNTIIAGGAFRCSPTIGARRSYHMLISIPKTTARAWRLYISADGVFLARNLVIGAARMSVNASKGHGAVMNDRSTFDRTRFGSPDRVQGWRGRTVDFDLSWLSEAEYQAKYAMLPIEAGKTRPVLAVPNSKRNIYLNDRIAYGTITEFRGDNPQSFKFNAGLTIDSIY